MRPTASSARTLALLVAGLAPLLAAREAGAHEVGLSRGDYRLTGSTLSADLTLSRREIAGVVPAIDKDGDGTASVEELAASQDLLAEAIVQRITATGDGVPCPGVLDDAHLVDADGVALHATYRCAARPAKLGLDFPMLEDLAFGHRHLVHAEAGGLPLDAVAHRHHHAFELACAAEIAQAAPPSASASSRFASGAQELVMGGEHVAFLVGLVALGGRLRRKLLAAAAFAAASGVALALSALGLFAPSAGVVGIAVALSVAYVGIDNLFVDSGDERWRIALPFGAIHGLGLAASLGPLALPGGERWAALAPFALGALAAQASVLAVALPLLSGARSLFRGRGVRALSALVGLAGGVLVAMRLAHP